MYLGFIDIGISMGPGIGIIQKASIDMICQQDICIHINQFSGIGIGINVLVEH